MHTKKPAFHGKRRIARMGVLLGALFCMSRPIEANVATATTIEILKEMPAKGSMRRGEVVYVDDGTCPAGEVKKITGGNQQAGVGRQTQCVKRPADH